MTTDTQHGVSRKGKRIRPEESEKVFVGADVHRKTYAIALWSDYRGLIHHWTQPADPEVLVRRLEPIHAQVQRVAYEAGPTGYSLVRTLRAAGFNADVIVTSKMLRTTVAGAKSDRLDCRTLAEHACKDLLKPVQVPSEQQERDRQLMRLRERLARKQRLARQQIKSFLLVHGIAQPVGLNCWSDKGINGVRALKLDAQLRFCLAVLIDEEQHAYKQVEKLTLELKKLATEERFRERIRCLRSVPGVGPLTAMMFVTELIAPERFNDAGEVARMLGLAPRAPKRRPTPRRLADERRQRPPPHDPGRSSLALGIARRARPRGLSSPAQNTGDAKKAIGGAARKLAIILWRLVTRLETYCTLAPAA